MAREWRMWRGKVSRVMRNGEKFVERVSRMRVGATEREREGDCWVGNG